MPDRPDSPAARAAARKALRHRRLPLPSAGRCERAEQLVSARLDAPLEPQDGAWLEAHLGRCPRCRQHVEALHEALLPAPSVQLPVHAPAEPAMMAAMDDQQPPAPDRPRMDLSSIRDLPPPTPRPAREITVELLPYDQRTGISAHDRLQAEKARRPSALQTAGRTLLGFAAFAVVVLGIFLALGALEDDSVPSAAWSKPGAPVVAPAPISAQ